MVKNSAFVVMLLLVVLAAAGCAKAPSSVGELRESMPVPKTIKIIPPGESVPKSHRFFSGVFSGQWSIGMEMALIVEEIGEEIVKVVYCHEDGDGVEAGLSQANGKIINNVLTATLSSGATLTCEVLPDGKLKATWERGDLKTTAILTKLSLEEKPSRASPEAVTKPSGGKIASPEDKLKEKLTGTWQGVVEFKGKDIGIKADLLFHNNYLLFTADGYPNFGEKWKPGFAQMKEYFLRGEDMVFQFRSTYHEMIIKLISSDELEIQRDDAKDTVWRFRRIQERGG